MEYESKESLTPAAREKVPVPTPPHVSVPLPAQPDSSYKGLYTSGERRTDEVNQSDDSSAESLESIQNPVLDDKFADGENSRGCKMPTKNSRR